MEKREIRRSLSKMETRGAPLSVKEKRIISAKLSRKGKKGFFKGVADQERNFPQSAGGGRTFYRRERFGPRLRKGGGGDIILGKKREKKDIPDEKEVTEECWKKKEKKSVPPYAERGNLIYKEKKGGQSEHKKGVREGKKRGCTKGRG